MAQPQTRSQDPIMAILQELKANMQSMDERVNKLSTKVDQTVNSTEVQSTNALTQNTSLCKVQNSISPTSLSYNATTEAGPEPLGTLNDGLTVTPTRTFRITLSSSPSGIRMTNKTAKLQPQEQNYSRSHRRLRFF